MLIVGGPGSGKTNSLLNLIKEQNIDELFIRQSYFPVPKEIR